MTDSEFDKLLRAALMESTWLDFSPAIKAAEQDEITFSKRYIRRRDKMLQDPFAYAKKAGLSLWQRAARTVAMILLVCSILFAVMWSVPEVRAAIRKLYMEWYETYIAVYVQDDTRAGETDLSKIHVEIPADVLPEGYREIIRDEYAGVLVYSDKTRNTISIDYRVVGKAHAVRTNSEDILVQTRLLDGVEYYQFKAERDNRLNQIIWINTEYDLLFGITASTDLDTDVLMLLAQNIVVIKNKK